MTALADRLAAVRERIAAAARAAGRDPNAIHLIAVTKTHPVALVRDLAALGVRDVAENRHQEARAKAVALSDVALRWHFVGQLQTNKARQVRRYVDVIHSVDRVDLVRALGTPASTHPSVADLPDAPHRDAPLECFVQVNLTEDPARGGVLPADLAALAEAAAATPGLRVRGLMAVAPRESSADAAFEQVRSLQPRLLAACPHATDLSLGMSSDFEVAVRWGATHLRIGAAIVGNREPRG